MSSINMQSLTFITFVVWVNPDVKVLDKPKNMADEKHVNHLPCRVTQIILCIILLMYVATIQYLNYSRRESKTCNLQFIFLTHLWPWHKVKFIKLTSSMRIPSKIIITQGLKDLALMVSGGKSQRNFFFFKRGHMSIISLEHVQKSKIVAY